MTLPFTMRDHLFLGVMFFAFFGKNFLIDQPALVQKSLVEAVSHWVGRSESEYYYSLMYVFYHMPVIFTLIFTGMACDIYGPPIISLIFAILVSLGKCWSFNERPISVFLRTVSTI